MWKESGERCSYSGDTINLTTLWTHEVEVDHILPYSRSLDNSYMNKVVCLARENQKKGNQTPQEAFGETQQWYTIEGIINNDNYPAKKRKNIQAKKIDDDFINNQLSDSRYIAKETGKYMRNIGCDVTFTKGGATSWLRHQWGLNNILSDTEKKERTDHRHHAIDATVIALTNRSLYKQIVHLASKTDDDSISPEHGMEIPPPLDDIRDTLEDAVKKIIVSHSTNRRLIGAFHEETAYGIRKENGKKEIVVRKNLTDMTDKNLNSIVCPVIKEGFETYVNMRGGLNDAQKRLKNDRNANDPFKHPKTGDIVRRVRVRVSQKFNEKSYWQYKDKATGKLLRLLPYGNNHHVEIIKNLKNGKYETKFVTTMEAARRIRIDKNPIVKTKHGKDFEFVMSLCINDMVSVEQNGERKFYRVQKFQPNENILWLRLNNAATLNNEEEKLSKSIHALLIKFQMRKESLNALGHLIYKNLVPNDQTNY